MIYEVFFGMFFFNADLPNAFPPSYPTDLATLLTYILALLPTNDWPSLLPTYLFIFSLVQFYPLDKSFYLFLTKCLFLAKPIFLHG